MNIKDIKFKAKRLDNGEWVEGDLIHKNNGVYVYNPQIVNKRGYSVQSIRIDSHTVCMFTGLKDTNDVPIFEGDIIAFDGEGEVVFKDGAFYAKFGKYTECLLCNLLKSGLSVTIIGNKFDKDK